MLKSQVSSLKSQVSSLKSQVSSLIAIITCSLMLASCGSSSSSSSGHTSQKENVSANSSDDNYIESKKPNHADYTFTISEELLDINDESKIETVRQNFKNSFANLTIDGLYSYEAFEHQELIEHTGLNEGTFNSGTCNNNEGRYTKTIIKQNGQKIISDFDSKGEELDILNCTNAEAMTKYSQNVPENHIRAGTAGSVIESYLLSNTGISSWTNIRYETLSGAFSGAELLKLSSENLAEQLERTTLYANSTSMFGLKQFTEKDHKLTYRLKDSVLEVTIHEPTKPFVDYKETPIGTPPNVVQISEYRLIQDGYDNLLKGSKGTMYLSEINQSFKFELLSDLDVYDYHYPAIPSQVKITGANGKSTTIMVQ